MEEVRTGKEVATTNRMKERQPPEIQVLKESAKISEAVAVDVGQLTRAETRMIISLSRVEVAADVDNSKSLEKADEVAHAGYVGAVVAGTVTTTNATSSTKTETIPLRTHWKLMKITMKVAQQHRSSQTKMGEVEVEAAVVDAEDPAVAEVEVTVDEVVAEQLPLVTRTIKEISLLKNMPFEIQLQID